MAGAKASTSIASIGAPARSSTCSCWAGWRTRRSSRVDKTGRFLYSVHGDRSDVTAYADRRQDRPSARDRPPADRRLQPDPPRLRRHRQFLFVTNYGTDSIAVLPVKHGRHARPLPDPDDGQGRRSGRIAPSRRTSGRTTIRSIRQGRFFYLPCKGADSVIDLSPRPQARRRWSTPTKSPPGPAPAPRHIDFHPQRALRLRHQRARFDDHDLSPGPRQRQADAAAGRAARRRRTSPATAPARRSPSIAPAATSTSPTAATTASACSRSIPAKGTLAPRQWVPTKGSVPRFFAFDPSERFLYVANQGGHSIVTYKVGRDGKLSPSPIRVKVPSPACIVFSPEHNLMRQDLRLRDPVDPCRRRPRSDDRRAGAADLPDHGLCFRRRRPRGGAVQPADRGLHLFAPDQPDQCGAGDAARDARRRPRLHRRRRRAMPRRCWRCSR